MSTTHDSKVTFEVHPIGRVRRNGGSVCLEIGEAARPALKELGHFSHVMVLWWADLFDDAASRSHLQSHPPYAQDHLTGVFATRSPYRPNPIALTTCKLLGVDDVQGIVRVADLDAYEGTAIVDLKAYFPVCDRVEQAHIPPWLAGWPEWMPDNGIGLEEWER
jgi:tRNA-Thr(GGU) m(6)t(6)A37 methyltransferase TsaA